VNIYREIEIDGGGIVNEDTLDGTYKNIAQWISLTAEEKELMGRNAQSVYKKYFNIENAAKKYFQVMTASK
jgi:glycosyltransferase involved in cell wall biosynthesis